MSYPIFPHLKSKLKQQLSPEITQRLIELGCWCEESGVWCAPTSKKAQAARLIIKGNYRQKNSARFYQQSSRRTSLDTGQARTARHCGNYPSNEDDGEGNEK